MSQKIDVDELLNRFVDLDGSDCHMLAGDPPTFRIDGHLVRQDDYGELTPEQTEAFVRAISPPRALAELEEVQGSDFGYTFPRARFRVSIFMQKGSVACNLRLIPYKLRSFEDLGLDTRLQRLLYAPRGLFLVTGPTGSGKTTSLATMIDFINTNRDCHIITIEDPIEYFHNHKKSIVTQREVGNDVPTFATGVTKALRQDPDIILVGEMRDLATISAAITAAETGHLVFSTLHTTGAARTVDRIVDVFPFDQQEQIRTQLSGNLICVLSQILLPRRGGGRVAAYEVMVGTPAIAHMIRERKTHQILSAIQTGQQQGMNTLDNSLWDLYQKGLIEKAEMLRSAQKPEELLEKLGESKPATPQQSQPGA